MRSFNINSDQHITTPRALTELKVDLTKNTFKSMNIKEDISFVDTPADIRDKYQYFTEASMEKLISIGYHKPFTSLEDGVKDYVQNYLSEGKYY